MSELFGDLFKRLAKPLLGFLIRRYNIDQETAEEIAQETWLAAYKSYSTFQSKSKFFTWLCKIAMFKTADYYRKYVNKNSGLVSPTLDVLNSLVSPTLNPEEELVLVELRNNVGKCLALLPEKYKKILEMRYVKQYSYSQIAQELNLSERSVEGLLYRAKKQFAYVVSRNNQFFQ